MFHPFVHARAQHSKLPARLYRRCCARRDANKINEMSVWNGANALQLAGSVATGRGHFQWVMKAMSPVDR